MELTPLDIRNQKFSAKKLGGLDSDEVQAFLNQVAASFEELLVERADLLRTINNDKKTVEDYRRLEKSLTDAVYTMQRALDEIKAKAYQEADLIVAEAKMRAEKEVDAIRNQANDLHLEIDRLKQMRVGYFVKLRNLMRTQEELLDSMENEQQRALFLCFGHCRGFNFLRSKIAVFCRNNRNCKNRRKSQHCKKS
ncbi:MAG: DivIVA domain-containing protein [Fibromonadales bacterium]|nr:DivIVA domain-containing protein [Fibromonadales bacterium]